MWMSSRYDVDRVHHERRRSEAMSSLDGDTPCAECGTTDNIVWHTANALWNNMVRWDEDSEKDEWDYTYAKKRWGGDPVLCIRCFVTVVQDRGFDPEAWRLMPEWPQTRIDERSKG